MKTVLLTAFEPFGGEDINPSWETVKRLHGAEIGTMRVQAHCLPCVFDDSLAQLERIIADIRPEAVIALGQAGGRAEITPERVAINLNDARIADNAGKQPIDTPVIAGAPAAYFSTLPVKAITAALREAGIPAAVSHTAGTFVCNHVFYGLMHLSSRYGISRSGFVHIPYLLEQAARLHNMPGMSLATLEQALRITIQTLADCPQDLAGISGGTTH